MKFITACFVAFALTPAVHASHTFYSDIHVRSSSGQYQVDATSPDNRGKVENIVPFQASFTYKCVDTLSGKTIWTRKQAMEKPQRLSKDSTFEFASPKEISPVAIYVSDRGTTLIRTGADELIVVSHQGKDVGKVELLADAFTEAEYERFMHKTLAGPLWTGLSAWYFLNVPGGEMFVVRPWWGRRIFVDVNRGKLSRSSEALIAAAVEREKALVMDALISKKEPNDYELSKSDAAYLSGVLKLKKAIPLLKTLEESTYLRGCTYGGRSFGEDFNNEVNPHSYCTYWLRQVVQLSLRRLGVVPKPLPCHAFELEKNGKSIPFVPPALEHPRHEAVQKVKVGMSAKEVLNHIGIPDFVSDGTWSYDMDANPPFSTTLTFDACKVTAIKREAPLWKSGLSRDDVIAW